MQEFLLGLYPERKLEPELERDVKVSNRSMKDVVRDAAVWQRPEL